MRGRVLALPDASGQGYISGDDGLRYRYAYQDLRSAPPQIGQEVDFEAHADKATSIFATAGRAMSPVPDGDWLKFYFSPNGRISRRQYWLFGYLILLGVNFLLGVTVFGAILTPVTFWCSIATGIKRCHDVDYSGWWLWIPVIPMIPAIVFSAVAAANAQSDSASVFLIIGGLFWLMMFIAALWVLIALLVKRGQPGPNRFGADPLQNAI